MNNKLKRIVCIAGVVILIGLYIVTLISAIFSTPATGNLFMACIFATVVLPVFMYAWLLIAKVLKQNTDSTLKAMDKKDSKKQ